MRILIAFILFAHGVAHLVGFAASFHLEDSVPYKTTVLAGRVDMGDVGIRAIGILWLLAAVAFAVAALGTMARLPWWPNAAMAAAFASLAICVLGWPEARIGLVINALLIVLAGVAWRLGWLALAVA